MTRFFAHTTQLPVGQGGMMTALLKSEDSAKTSRFRIVYDCGSVNREHLEQGISQLANEHIDILFVSHLDADHVNGIDRLLSQCTVGTVVLPCLDQVTLVASIGAALANAEFSISVQEFFFNPVGWLNARGARQVVQLSRDDDDVQPFEPPQGDQLDGEPLNPQDDRNPFVKVTVMDNPRTDGSSAAGRVLQPAASFVVDMCSQHPEKRWLLVPYAHPFPRDRLKLFIDAVKSVLKIAPESTVAGQAFQKRLRACLSSESSRAVLKSCYGILSSNNNKPSMSLFSGPLDANADAWSVVSGYPRRTFSAAWMSTGDADLRSMQTRTSWLRRYGNLLDRVGVFQLPHHGSNASIHDDVLHRLRHAERFACAAEGRLHHPHPGLRRRLLSLGAALHVVSESIDSTLYLEVLL